LRWWNRTTLVSNPSCEVTRNHAPQIHYMKTHYRKLQWLRLVPGLMDAIRVTKVCEYLLAWNHYCRTTPPLFQIPKESLFHNIVQAQTAAWRNLSQYPSGFGNPNVFTYSARPRPRTLYKN